MLAAILVSGIAQADFTGYYDHSNWTLELNGGDGSVSAGEGTLVLTGANNNYRVFTPYTIKAPGDGTFTFHWDYSCEDEYARLDTAGYSIDGVVTMVADTDGQSGDVSVPVLAGQTIGFWVDTSDGMDQPGVLTVTSFSGPAESGSPNVTGACGRLTWYSHVVHQEKAEALESLPVLAPVESESAVTQNARAG